MAKNTDTISIALNRLGLGARRSDRRRIAADPRGAVLAELGAAGALEIADRRLVSGPAVYRAMTIMEVTRRQERGNPFPAGQAGLIAEGKAADLGCGDRSKDDDSEDSDRPPSDDRSKLDQKCESFRLRSAATRVKKQPGRSAYIWEVIARLKKAERAPIGFTERLVAFWANHFSVSAQKNYFVEGLAGAFEREAIRPYVLGRFEDMLLAATRHPAMLWFLDNRTSVGPNSKTGQRREVGLNENHARELLELHTLGADGGYNQQDVTSLAKILTGWGVEDRADQPGFGAFFFAEARHEPGAQTVLGKTYADPGVDQGLEVIRDIGRHPSTAHHIARQLAFAFVSEDPPKSLVARLAKTFQETDGDLRAVTTALVNADETWAPTPRRYRTPQDFAFAAVRLLGGKPETGLVMSGLDALGQAFWRPASPEGFSWRDSDWLSPGAHAARLAFADALAEKSAEDANPADLAEDVLADVLTDETMSAVKRAASREQGLTLLLMSPEMQWR